ncbi:serine hydrolase domain-containing protein [Pseudoalteromonas sp. H105]|uniref:serine hydrolase domain-containing protein n=1 Tax=Pseudoalteromonas sp. H105 TaxID=1348393 RepID=UPI0007322935|nr:serine hydrolase [Pseudoalteromonas sp. H105]KTF16660.1 hydrolase [Pseudoalteromonas sp. H105]
MFINCRTKLLTALVILISFKGFSHEAELKAPRASEEEVTMDFWDMPLLEKSYINIAPEKLAGDLDVGKLGVDGGNKAPILRFAKQLADNKHGKYDSLLISHKGKLLFESYYKRGRIDLPHFQFSATKGYTSLMLARAIELGHITMADLHKPLLNFFKDLDTRTLAVGAEKITLHHVLSMSSGLRFSDDQLKDFRENREKYSGIAEVQAFLEFTQPITQETQVFKYQGVDPILVMHVLDAVVPETAKKFVEKEFFNKMGIVDYKWALDSKGLLVADSGVDLTSRDMLKVGEMLVNLGKWQNKQLLSKEYLLTAFDAITKPTESWIPESFNYGYLWYQTDIPVNNKNYNVNFAWGAGGNRVIVVNELDLVIVVTGYDREDTVFESLIEAILPAFI